MGNLDLLEDACARLSHTTRAMFGGHGLFARNGGMFAAIVDDDRIMLKFEKDPERGELIAMGGAPWVYDGKTTMKSWIVVPDRFYDEPEALAAWAARAYALAPPKKAVSKGGVAKGARAPAAKRATSARGATKKAAKKARR